MTNKPLFEKNNADPKISVFYQQLQTMVELCSSDHSEDTLKRLISFSKEYPRSSHAYTLLGVTYSKQGFFDAASINLRKALLLSPIEETALTRASGGAILRWRSVGLNLGGPIGKCRSFFRALAGRSKASPKV